MTCDELSDAIQGYVRTCVGGLWIERCSDDTRQEGGRVFTIPFHRIESEAKALLAIEIFGGHYNTTYDPLEVSIRTLG